MMASSSLNNLFVTFYLDLFVGVVGLSPREFYVGQTMYLVWNACNDPLFGWLQDAGSTKRNAVKRRARVVAVGGAMWALAFAGVWFPPPSWDSAPYVRVLHFVVSTCSYDGMLTLVELAHAALLSEVTVDDAERARFNAYAAACAGVGSLTSFLGQWYWNREDLSMFRMCALGVALASAVVFWVSSTVLSRASPSPSPSSGAGSLPMTTENDVESGDAPPHHQQQQQQQQQPQPSSLAFFTSQLRQQTNFFVYAAVASVQSFDCAFEKSSFTLFLAALAGDSLSRSTKASVVSLSFLLPWILALAVTPAIQRLGVYRVLRSVFASRFVLCFVALSVFASGWLVPQSRWPIAFLLANRVMSEMVCRVNPLVVSDLVDEDRYIHRRGAGETRSASVVGSANFFSKLAQSVGPMVGFAVMRGGGHGATAGLRLDVWLSLVPLACVAVQLWLWTMKFTLHGARLKKVKEFVMEPLAAASSSTSAM